MRKYEAMFIFRPDLNEAERTQLFDQVKETMLKFNVKIEKAAVWAEKRPLYFELKLKGKSVKFKEGMYYLVEFESETEQIQKMNEIYRINENILRFLISVVEPLA